MSSREQSLVVANVEHVDRTRSVRAAALNVVRALNVVGHPHFGQGDGFGSLILSHPAC
jgi:hypothetical protein